jgi:hypothetical protein
MSVQIPNAVKVTQKDWRFCQRCFGLFLTVIRTITASVLTPTLPVEHIRLLVGSSIFCPTLPIPRMNHPVSRTKY